MSPGLPSLLPFLERGLSAVDDLPLVTLGEQDCLLDLSGAMSPVLDDDIDDGDGDANNAGHEGPIDDDDDDIPGLEEPIDNNDAPGLEGPIDDDVPGLEETIDGDDDDALGLEEPMDAVVAVAAGAVAPGREEEPTVAPLELETERAGRVVLRFGGGSNENPGIADGCQARGLTVGELPRETGALLDGKELALLAEDDLPPTLAAGWLCVRDKTGVEGLLRGVVDRDETPDLGAVDETVVDLPLLLLMLVVEDGMVGLLVGVEGRDTGLELGVEHAGARDDRLLGALTELYILLRPILDAGSDLVDGSLESLVVLIAARDRTRLGSPF